MSTSYLLWPTREDYDQAMRQRGRTIIPDGPLRYGRLFENRHGNSVAGGANLYVCLYHIEDTIVRCFCSGKQRPPRDIKLRYTTISEFCRTNYRDIPALLPIEYFGQGIKVTFFEGENDEDGVPIEDIFPLVTMPVLHAHQAVPLGSFIAKHCLQRDMMKQLCSAWLFMVDSLEEAHVAHGDLDLTNVFVERRKNGLVLRLIDYDSLYLPGLSRCEQVESGHRHFQHPDLASVETRRFDEKMDRFSALSIYISLITLTVHPELYENPDWGADEENQLLLSQRDYVAEKQNKPNHIRQLVHMHDVPDLESCVTELRVSLHQRTPPHRLRHILPHNAAFTPVESPDWRSVRPTVATSPDVEPQESVDVIVENKPAKQINLPDTEPPIPLPPKAENIPTTGYGRLVRGLNNSGYTVELPKDTTPFSEMQTEPNRNSQRQVPMSYSRPEPSPQMRRAGLIGLAIILGFVVLFVLIMYVLLWPH